MKSFALTRLWENLNCAGDEEEGLEEIWASVFTAVQTQKEFSCRFLSQEPFAFQVPVISLK